MPRIDVLYAELRERAAEELAGDFRAALGRDGFLEVVLEFLADHADALEFLGGHRVLCRIDWLLPAGNLDLGLAARERR